MWDEIFIKGVSSILAKWMRVYMLPILIEPIERAKIFNNSELKKVENEIINRLKEMEIRGEEEKKQLFEIIKEFLEKLHRMKEGKE